MRMFIRFKADNKQIAVRRKKSKKNKSNEKLFQVHEAFCKHF